MTTPTIEKPSTLKSLKLEKHPLSDRKFFLKNFNLSALENLVDLRTGEVEFSLPIVNIPINPSMQLPFVYTGNSSLENSILGSGWALPEQKIRLHLNSSQFDVDHIYELTFMGKQLFLQAKDDPNSFVISNWEGTTCEFNPKENSWKLKDREGNQWIFGGEFSTEELVWPDWYGPGTDESAQVPIVTSWYLAKVETSTKLITDFSYQISKEKNAVSLSSVTDNLGAKILLNSDTRLRSIHIQTPGYKQELQLEYEDSQKLSKIKQANEVLFSFEYESSEKKSKITRIHLPELERSIDLTYLDQKLDLSPAISKPFSFQEAKLHAAASADYCARGFINPSGKLDLSILKNQGFSPMISSGESPNDFPYLGNDALDAFTLFAQPTCIVILLEYQNKEKELCTLYRGKGGSWSQKPIYTSLSTGNTRIGPDYFVDLGTEKICPKFFYWNDQENQWEDKSSSLPIFKNTLPADTCITCIENRFFIQDNTQLYMGLKNAAGDWVGRKLLSTEKILENLDQFIRSFAGELILRDESILEKLKDVPNDSDAHFSTYCLLIQKIFNTSSDQHSREKVEAWIQNLDLRSISQKLSNDDEQELEKNLAQFDERWIAFAYKPEENKRDVLAFLEGKVNSAALNAVEEVLDQYTTSLRKQRKEVKDFFRNNLIAASGNLIATNVVQKTKQGFGVNVSLFRIKPSSDPSIETKLFETETIEDISKVIFPNKTSTDETGCIWEETLVLRENCYKILMKNTTLSTTPYEEIDFSEGVSHTYTKQWSLSDTDEIQFNDSVRGYSFERKFEKDNLFTEINQTLKDDLTEGRLTYKLKNDDGTWALVKPKLKDKKILIANGDKWVSQPLKEDDLSDFEQWYQEKKTISPELFKQFFELETPIPFFLNLQLYQLRVTENTVTSGKNRLTFTGVKWDHQVSEASNEAVEELLGKDYILKKSGKEKPYQLFKQNADEKPIFDFKVTEPGALLNMYPLCIVYQSKQTVYVLALPKNKDNSLLTPKKVGQGTLIPEGCTYTSLAIKDSEGTAQLYSLWAYLSPEKNQVAASATYNSITANRAYQYAYSPETAIYFGKVLYGKIDVISHQNLGYERYYLDSGALGSEMPKEPSGKKATTSAGKISYDRSEIEVSRDYFETPSPQTSSSLQKPHQQIFSLPAHAEIARFEGAIVEKEEADYLGFEEYEPNVVNQDKSKWKFTRESIRRDQWSMTGQSLLHLNASSNLIGRFCPDNQNQNYVATGWFRSPSAKIDPQKDFDSFKATIFFKETKKSEIVSKISHRWEDWVYAEIYIPLPEKRKDLALKESDQLTIEITAHANNEALEVDHIVFCSQDGFSATAYDRNYEVQNVVGPNGLFRKVVIDSSGRAITEINQQGEIRPITTFSKSREGIVSKLEIDPKGGFVETFSPNSFEDRWDIDTQECWTYAPGILRHSGSSSDKIKPKKPPHDFQSLGLRFSVAEMEDSASCIVHFFGKTLTLHRSSDEWNLEIEGSQITISSHPELIFISYPENNFIWVNGELAAEWGHDQNLDPIECDLEMSGTAGIDSLCLLLDPALQVTYQNASGRPVQERVLEDGKAVIVSHTLYDQANRPSIQTMPARIENGSLRYDPDFVTNAGAGGSIWKVGAPLEGSAVPLIGEYGYERTTYEDNLLNQENGRYLSGKAFASSHAVKQITNPDWTIGDSERYSEGKKKGIIDQNGRKYLQVYNKEGQVTATYATVESQEYDYLQTTYDYDTEKRTEKILPPNHYAVAWYSKDSAVVKEEKFARRMHYDVDKRLTKLVEPDTGIQYRIYDPAMGTCQFVLQTTHQNEFTHLLSFEHNHSGQILEAKITTQSELSQQLSTSQNTSIEDLLEKLQKLADKRKSLDGKSLHKCLYRVEGTAGDSRGNDAVYQTISQHQGREVVVEDRVFYASPGIISSIWSQIDQIADGQEIQYEHDGKSQVNRLIYPPDQNGLSLELIYERDSLGRVVKISRDGQNDPLATFTYTASGSIATEKHLDGETTRNYLYDEAGFLEKISDQHLEEEINYLDHAYQAKGYFDGTVSRTSFHHHWARIMRIGGDFFEDKGVTKEAAKSLLQLLKNEGYLSEEGIPLKEIPPYPVDLPDKFSEEAFQKMRDQFNNRFPSSFSHQYHYGPHLQLKLAKYSVGTTSGQVPSFGPNSFEEKGLSKDIWQALKPKDQSTYVWGLFPKGIFASQIEEELSDYQKHIDRITHLLCIFYAKKKPLGSELFTEYFLKWRGDVEGITRAHSIELDKTVAKRIYTTLRDKNYIDEKDRPNPKKLFSSDLIKACSPYSETFPEIIDIIYEHLFLHNIGNSDFDLQVYGIDPNGNHEKYYIGQNRVELSYFEGTNQPSKVNEFEIQHDAIGNIKQAKHKGIQSIAYHPTLNRPIQIHLEDGRQILFAYDHRGERILKQVLSPTKQTINQVRYVRDEKGHILFEKETNSVGMQTTRAYIHGPRGLIGFIENERFYSVLTDHLGSVRAVVHEGQVVAAFDYLPYGQVMRSFTDIEIRYRYAGQEWDEETGLYNFHARLYDPNLGRFYQPDPKRQFASPYLYVGNSPVSGVDPDGEFAFFLAALILAGVGAYLGGAAANNDWNPGHWNYQSGGTWLGMGFGGLAGGLLLTGAGASIGALQELGLSTMAATSITGSMGLGIGYLGIAGANQSWNPEKWDWESPETWNAFFQGAALGLSAIGGVSALKGLSTFAKGFSGALGIGGAWLGGASANNSWNPLDWNWDDPSTLNGVVFGGLGGLIGGAGLAHSYRSISDLSSLSQRLFAAGGGAVALGGSSYVIGAASFGQWNFEKWDWQSPEVYNTLFGGLTSGFESHAIGVVGVRYLSKYEHVDVYSQGDCAFEAPLEIGKKQNIKGLREIEDPAHLREIVADEMTDRLEDQNFRGRLTEYLTQTALDETMRNHLPEDIAQNIDEIANAADQSDLEKEIRGYFSHEDILEAYIRSVKEEGTWGGSFELEMIAHKYELQIEVRMEDRQWKRFGDSPDLAIRLDYTGSHYDAFVRKNEFYFAPPEREFDLLSISPDKGGVRFEDKHLYPSGNDKTKALAKFGHYSVKDLVKGRMGKLRKIEFVRRWNEDKASVKAAIENNPTVHARVKDLLRAGGVHEMFPVSRSAKLCDIEMPIGDIQGCTLPTDDTWFYISNPSALSSQQIARLEQVYPYQSIYDLEFNHNHDRSASAYFHQDLYRMADGASTRSGLLNDMRDFLNGNHSGSAFSLADDSRDLIPARYYT